MDLAPDIISQLQSDFPMDFAARLQQLAELGDEFASGSQRVLRCIVFAARGHPWYFDYLCGLAKSDWRDAVVAAEYSYGGGDHLYDLNKPISEARIHWGRYRGTLDLPFEPSHLDGRCVAVLTFDGWGYRLQASGRLEYDGEKMSLVADDASRRPVTFEELRCIRTVSPQCRIPQCQGFDFFLLANDLQPPTTFSVRP